MRYVADLVGPNLLSGTAEQWMISTDSVDVSSLLTHDGPVFAVIAPHSVALYPAPGGKSSRNVWAVTVSDVDRPRTVSA